MSEKLEEFATAVIRANEAAWNEGDVDALDKVYDAGFIRHEPPFPDKPNLATYKEWIAASRVSYPDATLEFEQMIKEGNATAARWIFRGTHTGEHPALPIPPTGQKVEMKGGSMTRIENNLIVEEWIYGDYMGLFQQLGVVPSFEPEAE